MVVDVYYTDAEAKTFPAYLAVISFEWYWQVAENLDECMDSGVKWWNQDLSSMT